MDANTLVLTDTVDVRGDPADMAVSPAGEYLYVAVPGRDSVAVVRTSDRTVAAMKSVGLHPRYLALTPDGGVLYVICEDSIRAWRTADFTPVATLTSSPGYYDIAVSPGGDVCYAANASESTLVAFSTGTNTVARTLKLPTAVTTIGVSGDGTKVYAGSTDHAAWAVSVSDWKVANETDVHGFACEFAATPEGKYVVMANFDGRGMPVFRTDLDLFVGLLTPGWSVRSVSVSPDGNRIFASTYYGIVCVFGRRSGR
jgi:DNA-binding beta-propeller fold protein YncE